MYVMLQKYQSFSVQYNLTICMLCFRTTSRFQYNIICPHVCYALELRVDFSLTQSGQVYVMLQNYESFSVRSNLATCMLCFRTTSHFQYDLIWPYVCYALELQVIFSTIYSGHMYAMLQNYEPFSVRSNLATCMLCFRITSHFQYDLIWPIVCYALELRVDFSFTNRATFTLFFGITSSLAKFMLSFQNYELSSV